METKKISVTKVIFELFKYVGSKNYTPFIVLCRSRTGSNLLVSYLNSHSEIYCENEKLRENNTKPLSTRIKSIFGRKPFWIKAAGFKYFYYHPIDGSPREAWQILKNVNNLHIIHLHRDNALRVLVSKKLAILKDNWFEINGSEAHHSDEKIEITFDELKREVEQTNNWIQEAKLYFKDVESIDITYEELDKNPVSSVDRVYNFLSLSPQPFNTKLKKQNPQALSELISNFHELKEATKGTNLESYFME